MVAKLLMLSYTICFPSQQLLPYGVPETLVKGVPQRLEEKKATRSPIVLDTGLLTERAAWAREEFGQVYIQSLAQRLHNKRPSALMLTREKGFLQFPGGQVSNYLVRYVRPDIHSNTFKLHAFARRTPREEKEWFAFIVF